MRKVRPVLSILVAAGVTLCLSTGIASALKTDTKAGAHSCCPTSPDKGSDSDKTSAGAPKCCLTLAQSKIAHTVLVKIGLHECFTPKASLTPVVTSARAVIPAPDVFVQFLTRAVLAIRAPPQA